MEAHTESHRQARASQNVTQQTNRRHYTLRLLREMKETLSLMANVARRGRSGPVRRAVVVIHVIVWHNSQLNT